MPTIFFHRGMRFHFFANEGRPREPMHVHVERADAEAKVWVQPQVSIASNFGYNRAEMSLIVRVVQNRRDEIEKVWNEFFRKNSEI